MSRRGSRGSGARVRAGRGGLRTVVLTCLGSVGVAGLIGGGVAVLWGALAWLEREERRHWWVEELVPVDVDGEPGLEVVLVYGAPDEHATRVVEAVKMETGEVLRSGQITNEGGVGNRRTESHAVGDGRFAVMLGTDEDEERGIGPRVVVLRSVDGELLWDQPLAEGRRWGRPVHALFGGDQLLVRSVDSDNRDGRVTALGVEDGATLWEREVGGGRAEPEEIGGSLALVDRWQLEWMEPEAEGASDYESSRPLGWLSDGRYCVSCVGTCGARSREAENGGGPEAGSTRGERDGEPGRGLATVDGPGRALVPLERGGELLGLPGEVLLSSVEGIHADSVLYTDSSTFSRWIEAVPVFDGAPGWRLEYPDGLGEVRMWRAGAHALVLLETPLWGAGSGPRIRKLAAVDLRSGLLAWEGAALDPSVYFEEVLDHGEQLLMRVEYETPTDDAREVWLTFDGATGRFPEAVAVDLVVSERGGVLRDSSVRLWQLTGGVLFGFEYNRLNLYPDTVVAVDVEDWTALSYGPKTVRVVDCRDAVAPVLGGLEQ